MHKDPIVVGYDGSAGAEAAVAWAVGEAAVRHEPVQVVTVVDPYHGSAADPLPLMAPVVAASLTSAVDRAAGHSAAPLTGRVLVGPVTTTLCDLSWTASLLVVGSRGDGGFGGLHIGSVSLAVSTHAHCPVVVVPEAPAAAATGRPVLLGVDDCPHGRLAARFAFAEAAARGVGVYAVRAVPTHLPRAPGLSIVRDDEWSGGQQELLDDVLADGREHYPEVEVVTRVVTGSPGEVLAGASRRAQLLVVGSRGRGGFHGLLLGSVGSLALHHAACPVAVVRSRPVAALASRRRTDQG